MILAMNGKPYTEPDLAKAVEVSLQQKKSEDYLRRTETI